MDEVFQCEECECPYDCECCDEESCHCNQCLSTYDFVPRAAKIGKPIREIDVEPVKRDNPATAPAEPITPREPAPQKTPTRTPDKEPVRV